MSLPEIKVEISFVAKPFGFNAQVWTDVSADVEEIPEIRRGRRRLGDRMVAGRARVRLNNAHGYYTPGNWLSPYAEYLLPMRQLRISAIWNGVTYPLFQGFIERWPPSHPGGLESTVELEVTDWFLVLGSEPITLSRGAEDSHWRVILLLTLTAMSSLWYEVPTSGNSAGRSRVAAVSLVNEPILAHLQSVIEAEDGLAFVRGDGILEFQGRHHRLLDPRCTSVQMLIGDSDDTTSQWILGTSRLGLDTVPRRSGWSPGDDPERPYLALESEYDAQAIINASQVTASGGMPQTAEDADSQDRYGVRTLVQSLLITSDTEAADRAAWNVIRNSTPELRFPSVTVSGLRDPAMWPELLGLDLSYRVEVRTRPPASVAVVRHCYVEQIVHRNLITQWETTLALSPALDSAAFLILGTGVLDTNRLGY